MGKVLRFAVVFSIIFSILYYVINFDLGKDNLETYQTQSLAAEALDKELSEKLGTVNFGMEKYSAWAARYGLVPNSGILDADNDGDGLQNYLEYAYGTDPNKADTDSDGFSDKQELINGYDPNDDGKQRLNVRVKIEKLGIEAPMVWSTSIKDGEMLKDLENGVSHYYKTASPGQSGNMIISGHSSNYVWAKGQYNHVFKDLNNLEVGDEVVVNTFQVNGRTVSYKYKVTEKFVTTADDQKVFAQTDKPTMTLSTCWPIGTNLKRLIVRGVIEDQVK